MCLLSPVESVMACASANGSERSVSYHWEKGDEAFGTNQATKVQTAQFQLPKSPPGKEDKPPALPTVLEFSYAYGAEFKMPFANNLDFNSGLEDKQIRGVPKLFALVTYRPTSWLELTAEPTLEKEFSIREEESTVLPDGSTAQRGRLISSLQPAQLFARVDVPDHPFELTVGRRSFLDPRLWLYDDDLDGVILTAKPWTWNIDASVTRLNAVDLDLLQHVPKEYTNNYMLYSEYRGIEDHQLAAYYIFRDHPPSAGEGRPQFMGLNAFGRPSDSLNWWAQLGYVDGRDEVGQKLSAYAFDVGATYRFVDTWLQPAITLGIAYGSGDSDPNDNTNGTFRQTGLQSNEGRFAGVTEFRYYGEVLDPELSNLRIFTAGVGVRPEANVFVELVYHHYRLNAIDQEIRGSPLTAIMNDIPGEESKNVGNELDVVVGLRNLFGIRGLSADFRLGVFFPGKAYGPTSDRAIRGEALIFF